MCLTFVSNDFVGVAVLLTNKQRLNKRISSNIRNIPANAFYTALPQLISRVTHRNSDTAVVVETILTRVLTKFPSQAMWTLSWLRNSMTTGRSKIGERIFKSSQESLSKRKDKRHQVLLMASKSLIKFLIELAR